MRLKINSRLIDGFIQYSKCSKCSCQIFNLILQGDTDMATMGLVALTKPNFKHLILTEATNEEWTGYKTDLIEERISKEKNSKEFRIIDYKNFLNESGENTWLPVCPKCFSKQNLIDRKTLQAFVV